MQVRTRVQHLRCQLVIVSLIACCCLLVTVAGAQEAMLHDGNPALVFHADPDMTIAVDLVDHNGERALRLPVRHSHFSEKMCSGYLYVSRNRIAYDPVFTPNFEKDAFDAERKEVKKAVVDIAVPRYDYMVGIWTGQKRNLFYALFDSGSGKKAFGKESARPVYQFIGRSLSNFDDALHEAEQLTASVGQHPQKAQPEQPPKTEEPAALASNAPPAELREGQTPEEVEKALGKPEDMTKLKDDLIYVYPSVKVIFEKGKLVEVQYRENGAVQQVVQQQAIVKTGEPPHTEGTLGGNRQVFSSPKVTVHFEDLGSNGVFTVELLDDWNASLLFDADENGIIDDNDAKYGVMRDERICTQVPTSLKSSHICGSLSSNSTLAVIHLGGRKRLRWTIPKQEISRTGTTAHLLLFTYDGHNWTYDTITVELR